MHRTFRFPLLAAVLLSLVACVGLGMADSEYTIEVEGTHGTNFSGGIMEVRAGGSNRQQSVDGTVPTRYTAYGNIVSVSFQKKDVPGTLRVRILRDGKVIEQSSTSAAYGMVSAAGQ
jgi:hypothetical protein